RALPWPFLPQAHARAEFGEGYSQETRMREEGVMKQHDHEIFEGNGAGAKQASRSGLLSRKDCGGATLDHRHQHRPVVMRATAMTAPLPWRRRCAKSRTPRFAAAPAPR